MMKSTIIINYILMIKSTIMHYINDIDYYY